MILIGHEYISSGKEDHDCDGCGEPIEEGDKAELHKNGKTHKRCSRKYKMLKGLEKETEEEKDFEICEYEGHEPWEETPDDCPCFTLKDQKVERMRKTMNESEDSDA